MVEELVAVLQVGVVDDSGEGMPLAKPVGKVEAEQADDLGAIEDMCFEDYLAEAIEHEEMADNESEPDLAVPDDGLDAGDDDFAGVEFQQVGKSKTQMFHNHTSAAWSLRPARGMASDLPFSPKGFRYGVQEASV